MQNGKAVKRSQLTSEFTQGVPDGSERERLIEHLAVLILSMHRRRASKSTVPDGPLSAADSAVPSECDSTPHCLPYAMSKQPANDAE